MHRRDFIRSVGAGTAGLALGTQHRLPHRPSLPALPAGAADHMAWWREARFGMFIHLGLYSTLGGEWKGKQAGSHEWIRNNAKIPHEEYIPLVAQFNPTEFDADAYVRAAKDAGQKYVVFTTKHHEGFSLFPSAVTTYDVQSTPSRRDIVGEVARACHRHGLRIGWYYSIMDWYHPDYLPRRDWETRDATGADFSRYLTFMKAQLRELLTRYGHISVLWFDGQWESTWTHALAVELEAYCRSITPDLVINDRIDVGVPKDLPADTTYRRAGDYTTPELTVPERGLPGVDWETCMTMNQNWGYSKYDHDFKSVPTLVKLLVETASKGGNLLLNVGPMGSGRCPQESLDGLKGMGAWLRTNGGAIYGTSATPFAEAPVRVTAAHRRLNLFIDEWRGGPLILPGLRSLPRRAYLREDPALRPSTRSTAAGLEITLPDRGPGSLLPVITFEFDESPRVTPAAS
jgi:alpha-L-fucosidase